MHRNKITPLLFVALAAACLLAQEPPSAQEPRQDLGTLNDVREIREALSQLDHAEREELRRQSEAFAGLPRREKRRLRSFHSELMAADDPERLLALMKRYRDWLASLSANERAELLDLPEDERIAAIKAKMLEMSVPPQPTTLSPQDLRVFAQAVLGYVQRHEAELTAGFSESTRKELEELKPPLRMLSIAQRRLESQPDWNAESESAQALVRRLQRSLSTEAVNQLNGAIQEERLPELFLGWLDSIRMRHFRINRERLQHFFERELSAKQRQQLENLPPDEMKAQLQELMRQRFRERRRAGGGRPLRGP